MMVGEEWQSQIFSTVRLLVILFLFVANWAAVAAVIMARSKKTRAEGRGSRIAPLSILIVNLMYLLLVWMPFTIYAFNHDIYNTTLAAALESSNTTSDPPNPPPITADTASKFVMEYIEMRTGKVYSWKSTVHSSPSAAATGELEEYSDPFEDEPSISTAGSLEELDESIDPAEASGIKYVPVSSGFFTDLQTSAGIYTILLAAVVRLVLSRMDKKKTSVMPSYYLCAGLVVTVPLLMTMSIRFFVTPSLFAYHNATHIIQPPQQVPVVYTLISDIHICRGYLMLLIVELGIVLSLAALVMVVSGMKMALVHTGQNTEGRIIAYWFIEAETKAPVTMTDHPMHLILLLGSVWAFVKVNLVMILLLINGPFWTDIISWISNSVASISLVFFPLAILLSIFHQHELCSDDEDLSISSAPQAPSDASGCGERQLQNYRSKVELGVSSQTYQNEMEQERGVSGTRPKFDRYTERSFDPLYGTPLIPRPQRQTRSTQTHRSRPVQKGNIAQGNPQVHKKEAEQADGREPMSSSRTTQEQAQDLPGSSPHVTGTQRKIVKINYEKPVYTYYKSLYEIYLGMVPKTSGIKVRKEDVRLAESLYMEANLNLHFGHAAKNVARCFGRRSSKSRVNDEPEGESRA